MKMTQTTTTSARLFTWGRPVDPERALDEALQWIEEHRFPLGFFLGLLVGVLL